MVKRLYDVPEDFEAEITILSAEEGGRRTPAFNGMRWDVRYAGERVEDGELYMIWPEFVDEAGDALATDRPLRGTDHARRYILIDEGRQRVHRQRIREGTAFFCMEGPRKVARGTVTKVTGLHGPVEQRDDG